MGLAKESQRIALGLLLLLKVPVKVLEFLVEFQLLPRNLSLVIELAQGLYRKA
jgi:hypothetical protein